MRKHFARGCSALDSMTLDTPGRTLTNGLGGAKINTMQPVQNKTRWAWLVGTFFGAGYLKPGPGTYGSCAAVLLWYGAAAAFRPSPIELLAATLVVAAFVTNLGIRASTIVAREARREDPGFVVIDEVAGQLIALALMAPTIGQAALALVLFRVFDIFKPWPIRRLEALPEGTGIMLDDVAAGIFALIVGALVVHFFGGERWMR